jgi:CDP-diacylglycerol--glycerol-3-phosphate 3-phosphatidyltransferase
MSFPATRGKALRAARARRMWASAFNLPNQLTGLRLLLTCVLFGLISAGYYLTGFILFVIAASTDWLDGYFARKYGQVTNLGRILDPFADKVIICGTFIFLLADRMMLETPWGIRAWMVAVVVGRELLVTALRSFIEDRGGDFSANWPGKVKMVLQCIAAGAGIFYLRYAGGEAAAPPFIYWTFVLSLWAAIVLTVYSGLIYIGAAVRLLQTSR